MRTASRIFTVCAIGSMSFITIKTALLALRDARRYNRIREMSGQGSIARQLPQIFAQIAAKERGMLFEFLRVLAGLPNDASRYLAIRAM